MASQNIPQNRPIVTLAEARERGLKRYFTGKPCRHGHVAERSVSGCWCCRCNFEQKRYVYGKRNKEINERRRVWRNRNIEKIREQKKIWARKNKDKIAAWWDKNKHKSKEYRTRQYLKGKRYESRWKKENPEKYKAAVKAWRFANREKLRENSRRTTAARRRAEPEKFREYGRKWQKAHPESVRQKAAARRARKRGAGGRFLQSDIDRIFKMQKGKCALPHCRKSIKKEYHIDHITPVSKGGSNWPRNLQLLCASCNVRKSDRDPIVHARHLGFLI